MSVKRIVTVVKKGIIIPKRTLGDCIFMMKTGYFILKELHCMTESDFSSQKPILSDVNSVIWSLFPIIESAQIVLNSLPRM